MKKCKISEKDGSEIYFLLMVLLYVKDAENEMRLPTVTPNFIKYFVLGMNQNKSSPTLKPYLKMFSSNQITERSDYQCLIIMIFYVQIDL